MTKTMTTRKKEERLKTTSLICQPEPSEITLEWKNPAAIKLHVSQLLGSSHATMEMDSFRFYCVAVTFLAAVLLHSLFFGRQRRRRLPPAPALPLPFLGHLPLLLLSGKDKKKKQKQPLHATLAELAARHHGGVMSLRLGGRPAVVVTSAEVARECFSSDRDATLATRPRFPSLREASMDYMALTVASYGDHWRAGRRAATVHLLSARRVDLMSDGVVSRKLRALVRRLARASAAAAPGQARVELKRRLFDLSHSVLMEAIVATSTTYSDDADMSEEAREMKEIVDAIVPLVGVANMGDYVPLLRWLDVTGVRRRLADAVRRRNIFLYKLIDGERQKQLEDDAGGEEQSMIGVLLTLQKSEPELYTDTFIAALVANLLGVGTETTSTTTEWAMALLLNHPAALKKAQEEIDAHLGEPASRLLDRNDIPHLPYLHCVINETLRLCPAAPLLLPHEAITDCELHGYDVAAGTTVLVNAYAIHHDPAVWGPASEEFRPERFLDEQADDGVEGKNSSKLMLPFGMGRRKCPGESLAMRTMALVLGTLIQCFEWSRVGEEEVDMAASSASGTILFKAVPLEALCKPRPAMDALLQSI